MTMAGSRRVLFQHLAGLVNRFLDVSVGQQSIGQTDWLADRSGASRTVSRHSAIDRSSLPAAAGIANRA